MSKGIRPVVILYDSPAVTETFLWRHIRRFRADVVVVYGKKSDFREREGWKPHVVVFREKKRAECKEKLPVKIVRRLGEVIFGIPAPHWPTGMGDIWEKYVRERKPDVALAEYAPNGICALHACKRHNIPMVVHFHGYDASIILRQKNYRNSLPLLFRESAAVVAVSEFMRNTLEQQGCPPGKIRVIPCGAPIEEFQPGDSVKQQPCKFLTVSSFTPMKGTLFTLRAFSFCVKARPQVSLTMVGEGAEFAKAKKWAVKNGLADKVNFLGAQPIDVVRRYMAKSSVFLQHSNTTRFGHIEGWGVSMAEAAASGLAVIATKHGGIPDHVIDGKTGNLVDEGNWQAMGEKMIELADNPELREKMGLAGRKNIKVVGNMDLQLEKLLNVLTSAAQSRV